MGRRVVIGGLALVACLVFSSAVSAQALDRLMGASDFSSADEQQIRNEIDRLVRVVATARDNAEVIGARAQVERYMTNENATDEFRERARRAAVASIAEHEGNALVHKNRLGLAILAAKAQNPESIALLQTFLVGGPQGEQYPSVRYWAAKGLSSEQIIAAIKEGAAGASRRNILEAAGTALVGEADPLVAQQIVMFLDAFATEPATDRLITATAAKARDFDLGGRDAVAALKTAVETLDTAWQREIRPASEVKQPIIAALAQVMVQLPPTESALELTLEVHQVLSKRTGIETELPAAVERLRNAMPTPDPKLFDLVWVEQLNWVEQLLNLENTDLRLQSRPEAILGWTAEASVLTARELAAAQR